MNLTDGQLVRRWSERHAAWMRLLAALREDHQRHLGRQAGPIHWLGGGDVGPWTWLGFFWTAEQFWFGFGCDGPRWRPLIEANLRTAHGQDWGPLRAQLPALWPFQQTAEYLRLWAPADLADDAAGQARWFHDRSRELHEFALTPR